MHTRLASGLAVTLALLAVTPSARAGHHLWRFSQLFSNASGSTQFIELAVNANDEQGVGPFTVSSGSQVFNFVTNLPSNLTTGTWILLGTSNFAGLPGAILPDYTIPASFFAPGGGTLNYASGVDSWAYGAVPNDGVQSLARSGAAQVNAPHNFAKQQGSVNLAAAAAPFPGWAVAAVAALILLLGSGLLPKRPQGTA